MLLSTLAIAAGMFGIFAVCGVPVPFSYCLVFGALISPTDPVTVLGVLAGANVPKRLQAVIAGESLFNDGIGIALFAIFLEQATSPGTTGNLVLAGALEFVRQAGGGVLLGLAAGGLAFAAMRGIDEYNVELMISLALVACTYGVAQPIGVPGPVAMVVAGWRGSYIAATALAMPLALVARGFSIAAASLPLHFDRPRKTQAVALLTWSGLRGGIAVALALSLPVSPYREELVTAAYGIAIFTMTARGLSLGRVARWLYPPEAAL